MAKRQVFLMEMFQDIKKDIEDKIDTVETNLINADVAINKRIDNLDSRIEVVNSTLTESMTMFKNHVDLKITSLEKIINTLLDLSNNTSYSLTDTDNSDWKILTISFKYTFDCLIGNDLANENGIITLSDNVNTDYNQLKHTTDCILIYVGNTNDNYTQYKAYRGTIQCLIDNNAEILAESSYTTDNTIASGSVSYVLKNTLETDIYGTQIGGKPVLLSPATCKIYRKRYNHLVSYGENLPVDLYYKEITSSPNTDIIVPSGGAHYLMSSENWVYNVETTILNNHLCYYLTPSESTKLYFSWYDTHYIENLADVFIWFMAPYFWAMSGLYEFSGMIISGTLDYYMAVNKYSKFKIGNYYLNTL